MKAKAEQQETVLWRVDGENDFMKEDGRLAVGEDQEGAMEITENMATVTEAAERYGTMAVYTRDLHTEEDEEIEPLGEADFDETFPMHCKRGTEGAEFVDAVIREGEKTVPGYAKEFDFQDEYTEQEIREELTGYDEDVLIDKNRFNVFEGSGRIDDEMTYADVIVDEIDPDQVVLDGVATDVCVDQAVTGLLEREVDVYVVEDATKGIAARVEEMRPEWEEMAKEYGAEFGVIESGEVGDYLE
jgi:nicotinamidase/pyrazinamidase